MSQKVVCEEICRHRLVSITAAAILFTFGSVLFRASIALASALQPLFGLGVMVLQSWMLTGGTGLMGSSFLPFVYYVNKKRNIKLFQHPEFVNRVHAIFQKLTLEKMALSSGITVKIESEWVEKRQRLPQLQEISLADLVKYGILPKDKVEAIKRIRRQVLDNSPYERDCRLILKVHRQYKNILENRSNESYRTFFNDSARLFAHYDTAIDRMQPLRAEWVQLRDKEILPNMPLLPIKMS